MRLCRLKGARLECGSEIVGYAAPENIEFTVGFQRLRTGAVENVRKRHGSGRRHAGTRPGPARIHAPLLEPGSGESPIIRNGPAAIFPLDVLAAQSVRFHLFVVIIGSRLVAFRISEIIRVYAFKIMFSVRDDRRGEIAHAGDADRPEEVAVRIPEEPFPVNFRGGESGGFGRTGGGVCNPAEPVAPGDVGAGAV